VNHDGPLLGRCRSSNRCHKWKMCVLWNDIGYPAILFGFLESRHLGCTKQSLFRYDPFGGRCVWTRLTAVRIGSGRGEGMRWIEWASVGSDWGHEFQPPITLRLVEGSLVCIIQHFSSSYFSRWRCLFSFLYPTQIPSYVRHVIQCPFAEIIVSLNDWGKVKRLE